MFLRTCHFNKQKMLLLYFNQKSSIWQKLYMLLSLYLYILHTIGSVNFITLEITFKIKLISILNPMCYPSLIYSLTHSFLWEIWRSGLRKEAHYYPEILCCFFEMLIYLFDVFSNLPHAKMLNLALQIFWYQEEGINTLEKMANRQKSKI